MLKIILAILAIWLLIQLIVLGYFGIWGPFKFIHTNRLSKIPGNAKEYHLENIETLADSPLKGKHLLFLGSSVTYGSASMGVSMCDYLNVLDGCETTKEAVSGTTLTDNSSSSYLSRLKTVDTSLKFDAVIVQLSTNDASKKLPLGEISTSTNLEDYDTSTIIGSMEAIICYCYDTWNCPVIFYTGTKYDSPEYQLMVDSLLKLQQKWELGVINLWNDAKMNAISKEDYDFYMNDPIHPTQAGYLLWWVPKFETYLYEFLK